MRTPSVTYLCRAPGPDGLICTCAPDHLGVHEHGPTGRRWFGAVEFPPREEPWKP